MTSSLRAAALPTPVGPLAVVVDDQGTVVVSGFESVDATLERLAGTDLESAAVERGADLGDVARAVAEYTAGDVKALDRVDVRQPGGELLQRMWLELRSVDPGQTVSYSELAARAGSPAAVRLAGNACARNMVAPFVPCHRVVKADGAIGNYYYGPDVKRALLVHEGWSGPRREGAAAQLALGES